MKVLDLFSGIGGFSVGLERAGFETVAFCEIEPYCRGVLKKHWPEIPIYGDVRTLTGEQLRADGIVPTVIVGGYPCQPFSLAGVRRGEKDDRHLWPEVRRLVAEIRPAWCIFENVAGHITMGLDEVLSDLEAEDYAARPFVIPACGVDAPHRRDRVWIVAKNVGDTGGQYGGCSKSRQAERGLDLERHILDETRWKEEANKVDRPSADVADADGTYIKGRGLSSRVHQEHQNIDGRGYNIREQAAQLWEPEPNVGRVVNGIPNRSHRLKALGNAVVPQIPEIIGRIILEAENDTRN